MAIAGAHGTGKTTLLEALKKEPLFKDVDFLPEITRTIREQGFDINEAGTLDTQILVMAAHMQNLLLHKNFIVDRSLIDGVAYTRYLYDNGQIPDWFLIYCSELLDTYLKMYDLIIYIPVEFDIVDDGVRSINPSFRDEIQLLFEDMIEEYSKELTNIITVTGTVEQRVKQVIDAVRRIA